jgi:segregation and condensation protein B
VGGLSGADPGLPLLVGLDARVEALLAAAEAPVPLHEIAALLPLGTDVAACVDRIGAFWEGRGIELRRTGAGAWLRARDSLVPARPEPPARRLSQEALATLIVIAMHQPVTVAQIERVRRVRLARGIVESLLSAGVVEETDRRRGTGRAKLYGTTPAFLALVGIGSLSDMPTPEDVLHNEIVLG